MSQPLRWPYRKHTTIAFLILQTLLLPVWCENSIAYGGTDLNNMSMDQLMDMRVTTASKREQNFSSVAAAIYTVTQNDIKRSTATTLPDLLAWVPGLQVARINSSMWAITARGSSSQFANKLLVLIDGRSVYSPLFSGVYWDQQLPSLDDIQRIEIIRGPGASLWGANAVNGVVNIITYDSEQTLGLRGTLGTGTEEQGFSRLRYGFEHNGVSGRISAQSRKVDAGQIYDTSSANDGAEYYQTSVRADWDQGVFNKYTLDAGVSRVARNLQVNFPDSFAPLVTPDERVNVEAYNFRGNWVHGLPSGDSIYMQFYQNIDIRNDPLNGSDVTTTDFDLQYNIAESGKQRITWGMESKSVSASFKKSFVISADENAKKLAFNTVFFQDEIKATDTIKVTAGTKFQDTKKEKPQHQSSIHLAWQPTEEKTFWMAFSRAIRMPSILESANDFEYRGALNLDLSNPVFSELKKSGLTPYYVAQGSSDVNDEIYYTYEAGFRTKINANLLFDAAFYNSKSDNMLVITKTSEIRINDPAGYIGFVAKEENALAADISGAEVALDYFYSEAWHIKTAYTYYHSKIRADQLPFEAGIKIATDPFPENQVSLTSYWDIGSWQLDMGVRYVDAIMEGEVPAYSVVNFRLNKQLTQKAEASVIINNLLDKDHLEYIDENYGPRPTMVSRGIYGVLSFDY